MFPSLAPNYSIPLLSYALWSHHTIVSSTYLVSLIVPDLVQGKRQCNLCDQYNTFSIILHPILYYTYFKEVQDTPSKWYPNQHPNAKMGRTKPFASSLKFLSLLLSQLPTSSPQIHVQGWIMLWHICLLESWHLCKCKKIHSEGIFFLIPSTCPHRLAVSSSYWFSIHTKVEYIVIILYFHCHSRWDLGLITTFRAHFHVRAFPMKQNRVR